MSSIMDRNIERYNVDESIDYIYRKTHWVRVVNVIKLIKNEIRGKDSKDIKLLSLGCASGIVEKEILDLGVKVYGVDIAEKPLKEAAKKGVITKKADITKKLPFASESFDIILAAEVIEHLIDIRPFFAEMNRLLKKEGVIVLTTPNMGKLLDRIKFLFGIAPEHDAPLDKNLYLHIRLFTYDLLEKTFTTFNFKIENLSSNFVEFPGKIYIRSLAILFPSIGNTLIVKARKK